MSTADAIAAESWYLDPIEEAHRKAVGEGFCYTAVPMAGELYRLAIVRRFHHGFYPITEDFFMGSEGEASREADKLNRERRNITPREAAMMVASSMAAEPRSV